MKNTASIGIPMTANLGDRIAREPQTLEEKANQIAVDKYDITGAHIKVPTYFMVTYPNGETKALHHVRDAKAISDVIRQMHLEEEVVLSKTNEHKSNLNGLVVVLALSILGLSVMTAAIAVGIF
jgi:arginine/lysine/ornithine decarboxylase